MNRLPPSSTETVPPDPLERIREEQRENRFSVGDVFTDTFGVLFRNFAAFAVLGVVAFGLLFAVFISLAMLGLDLELGEFFLDAALSMSLDRFVGLILVAMLSYGAYQDLRGQRAGFGSCVRRGFMLAGPVIGVAFLTQLAILIGFALLIIPGIVVGLMLYVAVPVYVIERRGVRDSLERSYKLTKGCLGPIFGVQLSLGIALGVLNLLVGLFDTVFPAMVFAVLSLMVQCFMGIVMAIAPSVAYYHLRREKEGIDIEDIAKVFD